MLPTLLAPYYSSAASAFRQRQLIFRPFCLAKMNKHRGLIIEPTAFNVVLQSSIATAATPPTRLAAALEASLPQSDSDAKSGIFSSKGSSLKHRVGSKVLTGCWTANECRPLSRSFAVEFHSFQTRSSLNSTLPSPYHCSSGSSVNIMGRICGPSHRLCYRRLS
jgi:hypothetical protein